MKVAQRGFPGAIPPMFYVLTKIWKSDHHSFIRREFVVISAGGGEGGGYSIYGPNSYAPPIRVLFLRVRTLNRVSFLPILASCSQCFP